MPEDILTPGWRRDVKMDRRSRRTRNALTAALMALLKEKPLKNITVTELAERADVNRATFYVHFQDVYDMFDQVKLEFCDICRDLVDAHSHELARNENRPFLEDIFRYFAANEDAFATIFGENADGAFFSEVIDVVRDRCLAAVSPLDKVEQRWRTSGGGPRPGRGAVQLPVRLPGQRHREHAAKMAGGGPPRARGAHGGRGRQLHERARRLRPRARPRARGGVAE